jgi:hypothetical protein
MGDNKTPSRAKAKTPAPEAIGNVLKIKVHGHKLIQDIFCTITGCSVIDARSRFLIQVIPFTDEIRGKKRMPKRISSQSSDVTNSILNDPKKTT